MRISDLQLSLGLAAVSAALAPLPAMAAGGAHGVDDAVVEGPGACHLESWVSDLGGGDRLINLSPACTPISCLGGLVVRFSSRARAAIGAGSLGRALKWTVRESGDGPAIGLAGSVLIDLRSGHLQDAALIVPVTFRPADTVTINLNAGGGHSRGEGAHMLYGAQIDFVAGKGVAVMAEIFGRPDRPPSLQAGVRWTFDRERIDLDLLAGRQGGADGNGSITFGFTIRR